MRWKDLEGGENGGNVNTEVKRETQRGQCKIWE